MSEVHQLGIQLKAELESFLAALRDGDDVKKWLDDPRFSSMYESYETSVRALLADAIKKYELIVADTESKEEDFRNAAAITVKETLKQYLVSGKDVMQRSADIMIRAFVATQR